MNRVDWWYSSLLDILARRGHRVRTRNSWVRRDIAVSFEAETSPLISVRKTAWKNALREMEWFLSGSSDINDLHPSVRAWWEPWASKDGSVPYNYGWQFRYFSGDRNSRVDQIDLLIDGIRDHPYSRRNVITTWNTADMVNPITPITNCHGTVIQCFVDPMGFLSLVTYQRSVDVVCGLPHNLIQYWAMLVWLASRSGRGVGAMHWVGGDVHLYEAHIPIVEEIVKASEGGLPAPPELVYKPSGDDFKADDFSLDGEYAPRVMTKAEMIV